MPKSFIEKRVKAKSNILAGIVAILPLLLAEGCVSYDSIQQEIEKEADKEMKKIEQKVATDARQQYYITKRSGNAMDQCVQAGMVAAAYLQAEDERAYERWKKTEKEDCAAAGAPR